MNNSANDTGNLGHMMGESKLETSKHVKPVPRISLQVFCIDNEFAQTVQQAAEDRRMSRAHVSLQMGGIEAAIETYKQGSTPNLVIIENNSTRTILLDKLDQLAEVCDEGTRVAIIGHENDIILYRELVKRGVSEYLVTPITPLKLIEAISNLYADADSAPIGSVFAFVGAKGGVGSSVICHNTAWAMSELLTSDVVIADFDLAFGTSGLDFNQDPIQGIYEALEDTDRFDEMMLDRLLSKCSQNLSLFSSSGNLERTYDLEQKSVEAIMDVLRINVPVTIVDLPHHWTSWSRNILLQADEIVITAAPDLTNLRNAKNMVDFLKSVRKSDVEPRLVMNMVGVPKRPEISINEFTDILEIKAAQVIKFNTETFGTAANNGQMIGEMQKKSPLAQQFRELAALLTNQKLTEKSEKKKILKPLLKLGRK